MSYTYVSTNEGRDLSMSFLQTLTNVKSSPNKIRYYNALVYDGVKENQLVSYNPDSYNIMQHVRTVDRPVKNTNFREKIDEFSKKPVLALGNQSKVEYSIKLIPFETVTWILEKMNTYIFTTRGCNKNQIGECYRLYWPKRGRTI